MKFRQSLLVKHIQELAKTSNGFVGSSALHVGWQGVGNDRSITDCISVCRKAVNIENEQKKHL